jgi:hypothetical protein
VGFAVFVGQLVRLAGGSSRHCSIGWANRCMVVCFLAWLVVIDLALLGAGS